MKKYIVIILSMLLMSSFEVKSQERMTREKMAEEFRVKLKLSDEQVEEWKGINEKYKPEFEALRSDSLSRMEKGLMLLDIMERRDKDIKAMLTEEQVIIYTEMLEEIKERRREGRVSDRRSH
jgi:hypothetical protein